MTRRVHVLMISEWYPSPERPAAGTFVRDQAVAVARRCDVTLVAPPSDLASAESFDEGVRVLRLPRARGTRRMVRWSTLRALDATIVRLRAEGRPPDVIHAHVFSAGFFAVLVARRRRLPVVVSEHGSDVLKERVVGWDALIARFTYRQATLVCPVSTVLQESVKRLEPRTNSEVVENVIDIDLFAKPAQRRRLVQGQRLLAVARLVEKKGVHDLLLALRRLVEGLPDVTLEVIGDGPDRARLEALAEGLPVSFVGSRTHEDVAARMRQADVLVVPSLVETFGMAAIEGLAAGLRVVVTSAVPVADVVAAFGGTVTPPGNPTALAEAMRRALDKPRVVPSPPIDRLRERFGPEALAARWQSIYCSLVAEGPQTLDGSPPA